MAIKSLKPRLGLANTYKVALPQKVANPFYDTPEWRDLVALIKAVRGRRCEDPNCKTPHGPWVRIYGDHIIELSDGGEPLDENNVMLRCAPCHGIKTARERGRRAVSQPPGGAI